jgi:hypothetical protein
MAVSFLFAPAKAGVSAFFVLTLQYRPAMRQAQTPYRRRPPHLHPAVQ